MIHSSELREHLLLKVTYLYLCITSLAKPYLDLEAKIDIKFSDNSYDIIEFL